MSRWFQFQSKVEPVSPPGTPFWGLPWSEPSRRIFATALIASGLIAVPQDTGPTGTGTAIAAINSPIIFDKSFQYQDIIEPVSIITQASPEYIPGSEHQTQFDKWFIYEDIVDPIQQTVSLDWITPFSEPQHRKILSISDVVLSTFTGSENISLDKWYISLSEPKRFALPRLSGQFSFVQLVASQTGTGIGISIFNSPVIFQSYIQYQDLTEPINTAAAEVITVDKWFRALTEPVRVTRFATSNQQFLAFTPAAPFEGVSIDRWLQPLSVPTKRIHQDLASGSLFIQAVTAVDIGWFSPLSDPLRWPKIHARFQQASAWSSFTPEINFAWFSALAEPAKRFQIHARFQQTIAWGITTPPPAPIPGDYGWFNSLSIPSKLSKSGLLTAAQPSGGIDPFPIPPIPPPPITGEFTVSGSDVRDRFPTEGVTYTYAPITRRTN